MNMPLAAFARRTLLREVLFHACIRHSVRLVMVHT